MKKNCLTATAALLAWSAAIFGQTAELPYLQDFNSSFGDVTTVNKDDASPAFSYTPWYGNNYTGGVMYSGNADCAADDYFVTPALTLEKGKVYTVSVKCKNSASDLPYNIEFVGGATAEELTDVLVAAQTVEQAYDFSPITGRFTAAADGTYYIAVHVTAAAGTGSIYFDDFGVSAGVLAKVPSAVTDFTVVPGVKDGAFVVEVSAKAPVNNYGGSPLTGTLTVKTVRSDGKEVYSAEGVAAGADITFTDTEPLNTDATYTLTVINEFGESPKTEATSSPVFSAPMPVTNLVAANTGANVTVSWDASVNAASASGIFIPADVRYIVQRNVGGTKTIVADGLAGTSCTDAVEYPGQGQDAVSYTVTATYQSKNSDAVVSETLLIGDAYCGEYAESFADYSFQTKTWVKSGKNSSWDTSSSSSYNPACEPQDADNGLLKCLNTSAENMGIVSPFINVSAMKNPRLDFYVYQDNTLSYTNAVETKLRYDGNDVNLGEPVALNAADAGWHKYSYYIPEDVRKGDFQIVLDALPGGYASICVDNISIKDILDRNLSVVSLEVPAKASVGSEIQLAANLINKGVLEAEAYRVDFFVDGKIAGSVEGERLASDAETVISYPYVITPFMAERTLTVKAVVVYDGDEADTDDTQTATVEVGTNSWPVPQNLQAELADGEVTVGWERPEISTEAEQTDVNEDFEQWTSGATQPEQGWIFVDADGKNAEGFNGVNSGIPMTAMIVENVSYVTPHSGTKVLGVSKMSSYRDTPDEWIISPEVTGGQTIKFYAASYSRYGYPYYAEEFTVCWSEGGTAPEDFVPIGEVRKVTKMDWTEFTAELPVAATRFAVHVTAVGNDGLVFDDFSYVKGIKPLELKGYNVYRNGMCVSTTGSETTSCTDGELEEGNTYVYTVSAVYDRGESLLSEPVSVDVEARPDSDLSLLSLDVQRTVGVGEDMQVFVNVKNNGKLEVAADAYTVDFFVDDVLVCKAAGETLSAGAEQAFAASYAVTPVMAGKIITVEAVVNFETDEDKTDNRLSASVDVAANSLPVPLALNAELKGMEALLAWQRPEIPEDVKSLELKGYNIYRDGVRVDYTDAVITTFRDSGLEENNTYTYTVSAVYDCGESLFSNSVVVETTASSVSAASGGSRSVTTVSGVIRLNVPSEVDVRIYDVTGREVYSAVVARTADVDLPSGIYMVKIGSETVKLAVR